MLCEVSTVPKVMENVPPFSLEPLKLIPRPRPVDTLTVPRTVSRRSVDTLRNSAT